VPADRGARDEDGGEGGHRGGSDAGGARSVAPVGGPPIGGWRTGVRPRGPTRRCACETRNAATSASPRPGLHRSVRAARVVRSTDSRAAVVTCIHRSPAMTRRIRARSGVHRTVQCGTNSCTPVT
jgi:hypothetical protein